MRKSFMLLISSVILFTGACSVFSGIKNEKEENLTGKWIVSDIKVNEQEAIDAIKKQLTDSYIIIAADKTFTVILNDSEANGNWYTDKKIEYLTLKYSDSKSVKYKIAGITPESLTLIYSTDNGEIKIDYKKYL